MRASKIIKGSIFIFLLWWPVSFMLNLVLDEPLHGEFTRASNIPFTDTGWQHSSFQETKEKYFNENFCLRPTLVRIHNEIVFRLFDKVQSAGVILGKEDYLFGEDYVSSYFGTDFIGRAKISEKVSKLQLICDSLRNRNIDLLLVIAPAKGRFYPEYLPAYTDGWKRDSTNYEGYLDALANSGIHYIDFSGYFEKLKHVPGPVLYPKTGIHWSDYGAFLCLDSMVRYIEKMRHIDMPDIKVERITEGDSVSPVDMDVEIALNLLSPIPKPRMSYPFLSFHAEGKTKPRVLVIGDSFYWSIFSPGYAGQVFTDPEYWYYYSEVHRYGGYPVKKIGEIDTRKELNAQDVVILLCNESKLKELGWGFLEKTCEGLNGRVEFDSTLSRKIQYYEEMIRKDAHWLEDVRLKAEKAGLPLDTMIRMDAKYMVDHEEKVK